MTLVVSRNPATGASRDLDVHDTSSSEVRALGKRASSIAAEFARRPLAWRASLLRAMADELERRAPSLVEVAMEETALPRPRLEGELRRTAFQFRFFSDVVLDGAFLQASIDHATDSAMGPLPDLRRVRVPIGPVAVFGSSNFPFAFSVPGGDSASALAAGCPIVIKAHPAHPATSLATFEALVSAANAAGAPEGLLGLVFGLEAGVALVQDPAISAIGFTGSVAAGRALWQLANARATPIPFFGELGSANPLVVTQSAANERASEIGAGIAGSMTLGVGQFCTKPGLLFVPAGNPGDEVVTSLAGVLRDLSGMTMLSEGIAAHFGEGTNAIAAVQGVSHLVGGALDGATQVVAQLFEVDTDVFNGPFAAALHEECFGPLAIVVRYRNVSDLRVALEGVQPALTFSVFSEDNDPDAPWLIELAQEKSGRVIANQFPTGVGVSWSMQHGGPWPSTTNSAATSVGAGSIDRWLRPVTYQALRAELLPTALRDDNPLGVPQRVDGVQS
jgi:NADP-dependent aldehyde dehydrogenase